MNNLSRTVEIELLASTLRQQYQRFQALIAEAETRNPDRRLAFSMRERQARMQEVLDAIETRDMSPDQARENLTWIDRQYATR